MQEKLSKSLPAIQLTQQKIEKVEKCKKKLFPPHPQHPQFNSNSNSNSNSNFALALPVKSRGETTLVPAFFASCFESHALPLPQDQTMQELSTEDCQAPVVMQFFSFCLILGSNFHSKNKKLVLFSQKNSSFSFSKKYYCVHSQVLWKVQCR